MNFGATLRILRTDAGQSLRELGEAVGVSSAYLSRVENGHDAVPTPDRLRAIARALGLAPTALFEVTDDVRPLASDYMERVPAARELVAEIVRRDLGEAQLARVRDFLDREFPLRAGRGETRSSILSRLTPDRVVLGLVCHDFDDALDVAATRLASEKREVLEIREAMRARENESSTFAGHGFALPQAVVPGSEAAALVTLRKPLRTDTPDGLPLRVVLAEVHPRRGRSRLEALVSLAKVANGALADALCEATTPQKALRVLERALAHG